MHADYTSVKRVQYTLWTVTAAALLMTAFARAAEQKALFNGADLSGWRGDPAIWSVEDGAIRGRTTQEQPIKHNTFLIHETPFSDFDLAFKYRIVGGNSGLQYRAKVLDEKEFIVGGYQADFEAGDNYSGILYEEQGRGILAKRGQKVTIDEAGKKTIEQVADTQELQALIKKEDWNDYRVIAIGRHLQHFINGRLTADVTDRQTDKGSASGIIALQVHAGPPMQVYFKDIVITPLAGE